jgi:hypothetical protein
MSKAILALGALLLFSGPTSAQDDLGAAEKEFKTAIGQQLEKPLEDAIKKLVQNNTAPAAKTMLSAMRGNHSPSI